MNKPLREKYVDLMLRKPAFNVCEKGHRPGSFWRPKHICLNYWIRKHSQLNNQNICSSGPMMERHVITVISKKV